MSHIFISYSRKDIDFAKKIVQALSENDLDIWIDWEDIPKGEDWEQEIYRGIETADAFVFLTSPDSIISKVCKHELEHAVANGKRILPLIIRNVKPEDTHSEIAKVNWIFCREEMDGSGIVDNFDKAIEELVEAINTDYEWLKYHTRLQVKALEWEKNKKDTSRLIRGKELREAEKQLAEGSINRDPVPTTLQREFLVFSKKNQRRLRIVIAATVVVMFGLITWQLLTREWGVPGKWVSIPAGDFVMGMDEEEAIFANSMCQEGTLDPSICFSSDDLLTWSGRQVDANLDTFSILDNEVSKTQYQQCVEAGGCQAPEDWNYDKKNINNPATKLNWFQASDYCNWLGGRLPTEGEWEKAARGPNGNYFPWGNEWDASKSNLEHSGIRTVQSITQYGETDISYFGVKNMAGNVQEWTASEYLYLASGQTFANPVLERADNGENWPVIVRSGAWTNARSVGMGSNRGVDSMLSRRDEIGFRCVCPEDNTCETPWDWWWIWFGK